jgi:hypothetical protein
MYEVVRLAGEFGDLYRGGLGLGQDLAYDAPQIAQLHARAAVVLGLLAVVEKEK